MQSDGSSGRRSGAERSFMALLIWLIPLVGAILGGRRWLPPLASEHGAGIDRMIYYLLITVGGLFIIGHVILGYFIWRFARQGATSSVLPSFKKQRRWSVAPAVVIALVAEGGILVLGLPVWAKFYDSAVPPGALTIEVTTEQFAWNVRYPGKDGVFGRSKPGLMTLDSPLGLDKNDPAGRDDVVLLNLIAVPVNVPVRIRLRSKDTIHSFFLPNFRVKQDAVPGMTIEFWFLPTKTGDYELACAELCGFGHSDMRGLFRVLTREQYEKWLDERSAAL